MQDSKIGLKLPLTEERPNWLASMSAGEWGERAESMGYDSIWMSESWGADALMSLAEAATRTDEIRLCTAIVNTYSRTPAVLAMAGTTLQRLSSGRAVLGVGASHASIVESLHGIEYERPVRRTHETIESIKKLTTGSGAVSYQGEIYQIEEHLGLDTPIPVYNAALGEANRRATGRVADGWLPYLYPVSALNEGFETIAKSARDADRDPEDIEVTPQVLAATSDDPDKAKDVVRDYVARYVGNLPNYRNALSEWFPAEVAAIDEAWGADGVEAAKAEVTDDMVLELGVAGTPETAREQLRDIAEIPVVDCPIIYVPRSVSHEFVERTIVDLRPDRL